ncbi:hypothetical protein [Paenisporosarcina quisquiliarum]
MEKTATKKKQPITVTVKVSKELGGVEIAKHLLNIGSYKGK